MLPISCMHIMQCWIYKGAKGEVAVGLPARGGPIPYLQNKVIVLKLACGRQDKEQLSLTLEAKKGMIASGRCFTFLLLILFYYSRCLFQQHDCDAEFIETNGSDRRLGQGANSTLRDLE